MRATAARRGASIRSVRLSGPAAQPHRWSATPWAAMSFNGAAVFAYISAAPGLLIGYYHIAPAHFGWVFSVNGCALIAMNNVNARLLRRYTPEQILMVARPRNRSW